MTISERYELYNKTKPIEIGELVYKAGDAFDWTEEIIVDKSNQKEISMFWNSLYFASKKDADIMTRRAKAAYGEYQAAVD